MAQATAPILDSTSSEMRGQFLLQRPQSIEWSVLARSKSAGRHKLAPNRLDAVVVVGCRSGTARALAHAAGTSRSARQ